MTDDGRYHEYPEQGWDYQPPAISRGLINTACWMVGGMAFITALVLVGIYVAHSKGWL